MADAPSIERIEAAAFANPNERFPIARIRALLANPRARSIVAESGGNSVGWCVALVRAHANWRSGRVYSLAVDPAMGGLGIGRTLVTTTLDSLASEGVERVYLEARASNTAALSLYTSIGFGVVEPLPDYYGAGIDGVRMRRLPMLGTIPDR